MQPSLLLRPTDVAGDVYVITGPLWLPTQQQLEGAAAGGAAGSGAANGAPTSKWTLTHDWIGETAVASTPVCFGALCVWTA